jgi:phytoene dehydrogenase-like protein
MPMPTLIHDSVRLVTGSIADFVDDYLEIGDHARRRSARRPAIGIKLGPMSPGTGLNWLYLAMGEHDGVSGSWSFHKGGNGGFTQVLARAASRLRCRDPAERRRWTT